MGNPCSLARLVLQDRGYRLGTVRAAKRPGRCRGGLGSLAELGSGAVREKSLHARNNTAASSQAGEGTGHALANVTTPAVCVAVLVPYDVLPVPRQGAQQSSRRLPGWPVAMHRLAQAQQRRSSPRPAPNLGPPRAKSCFSLRRFLRNRLYSRANSCTENRLSHSKSVVRKHLWVRFPPSARIVTPKVRQSCMAAACGRISMPLPDVEVPYVKDA